MASKRQKYSEEAISKLSDHIRSCADRGNPLDYEIRVDGTCAVSRTNNPDYFDNYESLLEDDTDKVEVIIYRGTSNHNDKRIYCFKDDSKDKELNGLDMEGRIQEKLEEERIKVKYEQLDKRNTELEKEVTELEEEVDSLEKEKQAFLAAQNPLKGFLGEIGASVVENLVKRNPQLMNIPGAQALGDMMNTQGNGEPEEETEVEFKPKKEASVSEEDKSALAFAYGVKDKFSKPEFEKILQVLDGLSKNKEKIDEFINQLK